MLDMGLVRGLITVLTLSAFLGICWWAYRPGNRSRFDDDAWLAFEDGERPPFSNELTKDGTGEQP